MRTAALSFAFLVALVSVVYPSQADAQPSFFDGNDLYGYCSDPSGDGVCAGFIAGTVDFVSVALPNYSDTMLVCVDQGVIIEQLTDIVRIYLRDHPADRHLPASALVIFALNEAFPCSFVDHLYRDNPELRP